MDCRYVVRLKFEFFFSEKIRTYAPKYFHVSEKNLLEAFEDCRKVYQKPHVEKTKCIDMGSVKIKKFLKYPS